MLCDVMIHVYGFGLPTKGEAMLVTFAGPFHSTGLCSLSSTNKYWFHGSLQKRKSSIIFFAARLLDSLAHSDQTPSNPILNPKVARLTARDTRSSTRRIPECVCVLYSKAAQLRSFFLFFPLREKWHRLRAKFYLAPNMGPCLIQIWPRDWLKRRKEEAKKQKQATNYEPRKKKNDDDLTL